MTPKQPNTDPARFQAITGHPEAAGRKALAGHLARYTDLSIPAAIECMRTANVDEGELGPTIAADYLAARGLKPKAAVESIVPDLAGLSPEEAEAARIVAAYRNSPSRRAGR